MSGKQPCGCESYGLMNGTVCLEHRIKYCPLHEASSEMLEALKAERGKTPCGPECVGGGWRKCSGCDDRIKAAIAKAEGRNG